MIENLLLDVRYTLRALSKSPAFTWVAAITLMLGIGANIVVFGVVNAVLLRPLEVSDPESLYQIRHKAWASGRLLTTSYPAFEDFRRRNSTFSGMAGINAYSRAEMRWSGNAALSIAGDEVTGNYFDLLGVRPEVGRLFHAGDERGPDSAPYLVLSDALWRNAFHANPGVVGTTVELGKQPFTVVGVAAAPFHGTERFGWPDYWMPMANEGQVEGSDYLRSRSTVAVTVIGRLKPGVTPEQATENLNAIAAELANEHAETDEGIALRLIHPGLIGDDGEMIRGFLWGVTALALLVLLAACANLASLFTARAADRGRELALRVALGASRKRVMGQLLTEAVMVSLLGGAAGLVGAFLLLRVLNQWQSAYGHLEVGLDWRVYLAGLVLTLGSALLFGMVPARQAWRSSSLQMMKSGAGDFAGNGQGLGRFPLRDLLLGVQITICTLLVTASLVAVRGMERELQAPLGFEPRGAMLADLDLSFVEPAGGLTAQDLVVEKAQAMIDAVRSIPGVTAVGTVNRTPMTGGLHGAPIFAPGTAEFKVSDAILAPYVFTMSPGYLEAAGTRLLTGRDVSWRDTALTPYVAVVNAAFGRKLWGSVPAVGQRFVLAGHLTEVVGVAQDGKYHDMQESDQPVAYVPLSQSEQSEAVFVVRSPRAPNEMAGALRRALGGVAPNAPVSIMSWEDSLRGELFPAKAAAVALGVMGALAAMLAVTGIFGMAAYSVSRRRKELGIRVALGARKMQVMRAAVGRPMMLLGAGSMLGLLTGVLASRLLEHLVYRANPGDPVVVGGVVLTMALLGVVAVAVPARRALAVDPSELMREE